MKRTVQTRIYPPGTLDEEGLTYVIIAARQEEKWLFVRHRDRQTWEMPAGHIETGEPADRAAVRELFEETGTVRSSLEHLCDYDVTVDGRTESGRLYGATVIERETQLEHETAEVMFARELPAELTYPEVQTILFERACRLFRTQGQS